MIKLRDCIGLPILERESGSQIGELAEVALHFEQATIAGILVTKCAGSDAQGLAFEDLLSIGRDAVMVRDGVELKPVAVLWPASQVYYFGDLRDKQVYTECGLYLGTLVDIACDERTGEIKFYEISDGIISDLLYGRRTMPLPRVQVISEERLIVPEGMADLVTNGII